MLAYVPGRAPACTHRLTHVHRCASWNSIQVEKQQKKNKKRKEREDATKSCNGERDACTLCEFEMLFFPLALTPCITRAERKKSNRFLRLPLTFQCSPILLRTAPGKRSEQNCRWHMTNSAPSNRRYRPLPSPPHYSTVWRQTALPSARIRLMLSQSKSAAAGRQRGRTRHHPNPWCGSTASSLSLPVSPSHSLHPSPPPPLRRDDPPAPTDVPLLDQIPARCPPRPPPLGTAQSSCNRDRL